MQRALQLEPQSPEAREAFEKLKRKQPIPPASKAGVSPFCSVCSPGRCSRIASGYVGGLPGIHAMWAGDRNRKQTLVEHGFRLPSALDNRPLKFEEFERKKPAFKKSKTWENEWAAYAKMFAQMMGRR